MLKGIQLQLLCGPSVPVPVPQAMIEALETAEVRIDAQRMTFQLTFGIGKASALPAAFLPADGPPPQSRVILVVTVNGTPDVLADGVVTHLELNPGDGGTPATLTVTGEDLSVLMSREELTGTPYPGMATEARVAHILRKYAQYGIVPDIRPPALSEAPSPAERIPQHQGHDLDYLRLLARRVGHVFHLLTTPQPGRSIAYWGPMIRAGAAQPALNVDMDSHTNTEGLSFTFDHTQRLDPVLYVQNPASKQAERLPPSDPAQLGAPLGRVRPAPFRKEIVSDAANKTVVQATLSGLGAAVRSANAVSASGRLHVRRYGRLLSARALVGLRGAGPAFDGLWWVDSVTHRIDCRDYVQSFTLKRNALVSSVSQVPA